MPECIAAIDQGTTSTRCILFDKTGPLFTSQVEHRQIFPSPGWVEHDPLEIWQRTQHVCAEAKRFADERQLRIIAIGITNQRETVIPWNRQTGRPYQNAIVWSDTRTKAICDHLAQHGGIDRFRDRVGLPLATYFSGPKMRWMMDQSAKLARDARNGDAIFGTIDTWLLWNLTGGTAGGVHVTDVTNASRTMLMDLNSLQWDQQMLSALDIPAAALPQIRPSSLAQGFGRTSAGASIGAGIPITAVLGDQHAALVGQTCFEVGESKNTYGTGCFLLTNTGPASIQSRSGLLTTLAYQFDQQPPMYALEGSVAVAGSLVQWLRDNMGFIQASSEIESLAASVCDSGGVAFVPAFSGLFAPWWRSDARGLVIGLTQQTGQAHIARAVLDAVAMQTKDVIDAMTKDAAIAISTLKVDGGMSANNLLMQTQSDVLRLPVVRSAIKETTALGAAYAAGLAVGYWSGTSELRQAWQSDATWTPAIDESERQQLHSRWLKAVERSMGWA